MLKRAILTAALVLGFGAGCVPSVEDSAAEALVRLQGRSRAVSEPVLDLFTADSRQWILGMGSLGRTEQIMGALETTLEHGRPSDRTPGLYLGNEPEATVFFVRDGHANRVDLALSGVVFSDLRDFRYPSPW